MDAYAKLFPRASRSNKVGQRAARLRITGQRPFIAPIKYQESHSPPGSPRLSAYADAPLEAAWQLTNDSKSVCILARTLCDCETDCGLDHREDGSFRGSKTGILESVCGQGVRWMTSQSQSYRSQFLSVILVHVVT